MNSPQKSKWLIWDFDGTLAIREGGWTGTMLGLLKQRAPELGVTADRIRPHLQSGFPWHTPQCPHTHLKDADQWWLALTPVFERVFTAVGLQRKQAAQLATEVREAYTAPAAWRLFDDTLPALGRLSNDGWSHAVLSNHCPELPEIMRHLKLDGHFAAIVNSAVIGYEKPHPEAFRAAVAAIGPASDVWMIGDSMAADIAGASAAGIKAILVRKSDPAARVCCQSLADVQRVLSGTGDA